MYDRGNRIEKRQRVLVSKLADGLRQRRRGQRPGRDDDVAPILRRQTVDLGATNFDQRMIIERFGDGGGKSVAVHRQRAAGGHLIGVGGAHDQRVQPAHFGVQQADRVVGGIVGAERIGAHEFGKAVGAMGFGHPAGAHLMQDNADARLGDLPGRFRAGKARADDMYGFRSRSGACHGHRGSAFPGAVECGAGLIADTTTPAARRALSVCQFKKDQPL